MCTRQRCRPCGCSGLTGRDRHQVGVQSKTLVSVNIHGIRMHAPAKCILFAGLKTMQACLRAFTARERNQAHLQHSNGPRHAVQWQVEGGASRAHSARVESNCAPERVDDRRAAAAAFGARRRLHVESVEVIVSCWCPSRAVNPHQHASTFSLIV